MHSGLLELAAATFFSSQGVNCTNQPQAVPEGSKNGVHAEGILTLSPRRESDVSGLRGVELEFADRGRPFSPDRTARLGDCSLSQ